MYRFSFFMIILLNSFSVFAQDHTIIQVRDGENGKPIENAYVNVYRSVPKQLESTTLTDNAGTASIPFESYPVEIEVIALGYNPEYLQLNSAASDLSFSLTKRFGSLKEVVVTGVSKPSKINDATAIYKIITAATIRAQGGVTLNDVLDNQLNMTVTNDGVLGAKIKMQGMTGDKVKLLIDGVPVNGRENGNVDFGQINLANTERIEIIQGPMSVVYGADALGGVINLITKNNKKTWEAEANAYYESIGKYNFSLSGTKSYKKHSFTLAAGRNYFDGWKYLDTISPHREFLFKPKEQYFGNFNYSYAASSGFHIRFASDFLKEKLSNKGVANISPFFGYANDEYYNNTRSINRLSLEGKLGKTARWQLTNGYSYYHRIRSRYRRDLVTLEQNLTTGTGDQDTSIYKEYNFRGTYDNQFRQLSYTVGYDIDLQTGNSQKIPDGTRMLNDYAAYAILKYPLRKKLTAELGLRAAYNTIYPAPVVPSFNLLYKPNEKLNLRASYAKGFRAPGLKELYLDFVDQNHDIRGNENLKAEKGDHIQVSASYILHEKQANYAQLLITGYYNDVYNSIALVPLDSGVNSLRYTYGNLERTKNAIGTIELEGQQSNLHYKLGYAYTKVFSQTGYASFNIHEMNASLQYFWKWSKLNFSMFNRLTGAQPFLMNTIDGGVTYNGSQKAYDLLDFSLQRKFFKNKVELTAGIKNILDVQTVTATGVITSGIHSGDGNTNFLPRRFFSSLRILLD